MPERVSIAIETSCRRGGVALGAGGELVESLDFQAGRRHAVQLVARLDEMLSRRGLAPGDLDQVYVSAGPGSFTGLRVGLTVARALSLTLPGLRCVAVPTVRVVAEAAAPLPGERFAVIMDAKEETVYAAGFVRAGDGIAPDGPPRLVTVRQFLAETARPITLLGEGLGYHDLTGEGVTIADESLWLPTAAALWRVGNRMAAEGRFTPRADLTPLYLRQPEAVRLWERRYGEVGNNAQSGR